MKEQIINGIIIIIIIVDHNNNAIIITGSSSSGLLKPNTVFRHSDNTHQKKRNFTVNSWNVAIFAENKIRHR